VNPASNSNKRYFVTFIDDYNRKTWVYLLAEKSEAIEKFKLFKTRVDKETSLSIQALRTDHGGEYSSAEFVNLCEIGGIQRQLTAAYTPQQNGVAERKNRTIMNMVRSLLSNKKMPKTFWPEAVNWSVHSLNRSPTLAVKNIIPEKAWSSLKPTVDHFRIFGCVACIHVPDTKRRKLYPKGEKCILLGVSEESKAYRLYNSTTKKIHISKDVVFDENRSWNWEYKDKEERITLDFDDKEESDDGDNVANDVAKTNQDDDESERAETSLVNTQRTRRPPIWMSDYTSGEEISDDNIAAHHALFVENDPITFEEPIKSAK